MAVDTKLLAQQASLALQDRDRAGLVKSVIALIDARAPMTQGWKSLTEPLLDYGELDLARRAIDLYVSASGSTAAARFDQVLIYVRAGRAELAQTILDRIPPTVPDPVGHAYLRGTIALNLGKAEVARSALIEAVDRAPTRGQIWQTLSMLGPLERDGDLADRILAAEVQMRAAPVADLGPYLYALGKTFDDLGDTDRAFAAFAEGAAIIARQRPYDAAVDRQSAAQAIEGWTSAEVEELSRNVTLSSSRPIVVTGLPRSGSTLVEHILASHSAVSGGDELGKFGIVAEEVGGTSAQMMRRWLERNDANAAGRLFLHLIGQRFSGAGRVIDKTLEASRYLGSLAVALPDTPILWMQRDPLDNAWSAFHTFFLSGVAWSWSQEAIAEHFRQEDQLLAFWQDVLGDRLKIVRYEELVMDKTSVIPAILAHCKLDPEPQVFSPETSDRLVTTASVMQVRQPINMRSVGSGHRYRDQLAPFISAYGYTD